MKPANVLVSEEGRVKLADFGLAMSRELDQDVTRTAGVVGTVAYMSPEQASGAEVGPASDVFSFGVLAYELLTGQRPFKGQGPGAVTAAIIRDGYTPIVAVRREVPGKLAAVVERCLEKDPAARFQSAKDVASALQRASSDSGGPARVETGAPRNRAPAAREQEIRFCTTSDGVSVAYSAVGTGPFVVRVLGHFTHLEMEWEWPDLRHCCVVVFHERRLRRVHRACVAYYPDRQ